MVLEPLTHSFNAPDTDFHNGLGVAMKWCETTRNTSFRHKVVEPQRNAKIGIDKIARNLRNHLK